jgi:hypothetical protein
MQPLYQAFDEVERTEATQTAMAQYDEYASASARALVDAQVSLASLVTTPEQYDRPVFPRSAQVCARVAARFDSDTLWDRWPRSPPAWNRGQLWSNT